MVHYESLGLSLTLNTRLTHSYSLLLASRSPLSDPLIHSLIHSFSSTGAEMNETLVWIGCSTFSLKAMTQEAEVKISFCALISPFKHIANFVQ